MVQNRQEGHRHRPQPRALEGNFTPREAERIRALSHRVARTSGVREFGISEERVAFARYLKKNRAISEGGPGPDHTSPQLYTDIAAHLRRSKAEGQK